MLTEKKIVAAKPRDTAYRLNDTDGLSLLVLKSGTKSWRFRYSWQKKQIERKLGRHPAVSLREARALVNSARIKLDRGEAPFDDDTKSNAVLFNDAAQELLAAKQQHTAASYYEKVCGRFDNYILPALGKTPIADVTLDQIRAVILPIADSGRAETARRVLSLIGEVFRHAMLRGYVQSDPTQALRGIIKKPKPNHFSYITDRKILGELMRALNSPQSSVDLSVWYAARLAPHVFLRPSELVGARTGEFDFDSMLWRVPAERMKMRRLHLVPLSDQVAALIQEIMGLRGDGLLFPSPINGSRSIVPNSLNVHLKRLGFGADVITPHGFRGTAVTFLNEAGFDYRHIDRQLSHESISESDAHYNHAQYLDQRRELMTYWSDFLDKCAANN